MKKIILFTSKACPQCPAAKSWANLNLKSYDLVVTGEDIKGTKLAKRLGIRQVPTFAIGDLTYTFKEFKEMWSK